MGRTTGRRPAWKKAIVKLRAGDTIEGIFEG
jgi:ribosomal protein L23